MQLGLGRLACQLAHSSLRKVLLDIIGKACLKSKCTRLFSGVDEDGRPARKVPSRMYRLIIVETEKRVVRNGQHCVDKDEEQRRK